MEIYVVKAGDTLSSIAQRYSVSVESLMVNNGIKMGETLVVGQAILVLFARKTYTVKAGDTLFSIARENNITPLSLLRNNYFLMGQTNITPGMELVIEYETPKGKNIIVNSYAYPEINKVVLDSSVIYQTYLSPFTYGFTVDGNLIQPDDAYLIQRAKNYGVKTLLHLSTLTEEGNFSNALASVLLNDVPLQYKLIEQMLNVCREKGFSGVDIDFEFVYKNEATLYADFVRRVREEFNPNGYKVIVAVAPKTSANQKGDIYEGHNYRLLGESANYVFIMTYEWGYSYSPPMAVAPYESVKRVLDYGVTEIPPSKILMGMPNYGYDWTLPYLKGETKARVIGNLEAVSLARDNNAEILFDEYSKTPHFNYTKDGVEHEVWFEDARSIKAKLELIDFYNLSGVGYWNMMRPFPQNWLLLNAMYNII